jgi:hypothetical protein
MITFADVRRICWNLPTRVSVREIKYEKGLCYYSYKPANKINTKDAWVFVKGDAFALLMAILWNTQGSDTPRAAAIRKFGGRLPKISLVYSDKNSGVQH